MQYLIIGGADSDVAADAWTQRAGVPTDGQLGRRYVMALSHVQEQLFLGGVGLVPPERDIEFWMLLLTKLVGLMLLAAFFASLASKMVSDHRASSRIYREKVSQLEEWMKTVKLPVSTKAKLRAHLESKYPGGRSFEESRVLDELSPPLRRELCLFQAQDVLRSSQILSSGLASAGLAGALALTMTRIVFIHGDEIIGEGRRSDGLYIISEGEVTVEQAKRDEDGKLLDETSMLAKLDKGKIFGEMSILNNTGLAQASVTVSSLKLVAFKLSYEAFEKLMSEYPELKTFIERLVRSRNKGSLDFATKRFDAFLSHGPPPAPRVAVSPSARMQSYAPRLAQIGVWTSGAATTTIVSRRLTRRCSRAAFERGVMTNSSSATSTSRWLTGSTTPAWSSASLPRRTMTRSQATGRGATMTTASTSLTMRCSCAPLLLKFAPCALAGSRKPCSLLAAQRGAKYDHGGDGAGYEGQVEVDRLTWRQTRGQDVDRRVW